MRPTPSLCRARLQPGRLYYAHPGDVVTLAEPDIAFEVQALPHAPPAPLVAASNGTLEHAAAALPPVVAALHVASGMEGAAAKLGHFPPGGADQGDLTERARALMAADDHPAAHALLLAGVMRQPWAGSLWAQLANLERQRARAKERGATYGAARVFYGAAAACFGALTAEAAGGELCAAAERSEGLARTLSGWAQMELSLEHGAAARTLFRRGVSAAREHPAGASAAGAPQLLVTWAAREWRAGDAAGAQRLCVEALELEPANVHALTMLGTIEASSCGPWSGCLGDPAAWLRGWAGRLLAGSLPCLSPARLLTTTTPLLPTCRPRRSRPTSLAASSGAPWRSMPSTCPRCRPGPTWRPTQV